METSFRNSTVNSARPPKSPPKSPPLDSESNTRLASYRGPYSLTVNTNLLTTTPLVRSTSDSSSERAPIVDGLFTASSTPTVHYSSSSSSTPEYSRGRSNSFSPNMNKRTPSNSVSPSFAYRTLVRQMSDDKLEERLKTLKGVQPDLHPDAQLLHSGFSKTKHLVSIIQQKDDEIKMLREMVNQLRNSLRTEENNSVGTSTSNSSFVNSTPENYSDEE